MVMCIGCSVPDVAFGFPLPLLHVTWLMRFCHSQQAIGDRIHDRICDARLSIVGLVVLSHLGGTGVWFTNTAI
jgi:hypothetical protein